MNVLVRFEPRCDDFDRRVRDSFSKQSFMRTLNASIIDISPGRVKLNLPFDKMFSQQHGYMHAGATTTVLDTACGYAALSLMKTDTEVLTVEFKTNLLAPASGETFELIGTVTKPGRTLFFCDGEAFSVTGMDRKLVATMSATMMSVPTSQEN